MNFVFIHGNYPAQFRCLTSLLAKDETHKVVYITESSATTDNIIEGVEITKYSLHRGVAEETHHYLKKTEEAVLTGQAIVKKLSNLLEKGFIPDIIISHGGNGLGLFVKHLIPKALHIGYFEWYFLPETTKYLVKEMTFDKRLECSIRNMPILQELEQCDLAIVPTEWQKKQFPEEYQKKLTVIFDGIDVDFFKGEIKSNSKKDIIIKEMNGVEHKIPRDRKILTYATRGMEPIRGFPEFMKSVSILLKHDNNIDVYIAGSDRVAYSYKADTHNGSWKEKALSEIEENQIKNRIIFTGLLSYGDYRNLLWRSDLHCYFTKPYVTSWSFFEAGACESYVAANKNEATEGIYVDGTIKWIDIEDATVMAKQLHDGLYDMKKQKGKLQKGYTLDECLLVWQREINKGLIQKREKNKFDLG